MDKYLSIITNFGCHYKCPYCIVRENGIQVPVTTVKGLEDLEQSIQDCDADIVSISGGGDPLHNYTNHVDYYGKLFNTLEKCQIPMEMHTSYIEAPFPYHLCDRVVYHLNSIEQLYKIKCYGEEIVRVVFVVEQHYTEEMVQFIAEYCKSSLQIDELSFRQLVNGNFNEKHYLEDFLKNGHGKHWHYIEQCDYNTYYVNGNIYTKFSDIH